MELRQLQHFVAVANTLKFTDAAVAVGVSQPALSASVKALERELGAELFTRTSRRVALTQVGAALLPEARRLLGLAEALPRITADAAGTVSGTVAIGVVQTVVGVDLAGILARVRRDHPGIGFRVVQDTASQMSRQVHDGGLDLAFVYRGGPMARGLHLTDLYDERLVVLVAGDHRLAQSGQVRLEDLRDEAWVDFAPGTDLAATVDDAAHRHRLARKVTAQVAQMRLLTDLVRAGLGIAVVPETVTPVAGTAVVGVAGHPLRRTLALARRPGPWPSRVVEVVGKRFLAAAQSAPQAPGASLAPSGGARPPGRHWP
jgi:DNA-binding transcriptional LysR family regulator